MLYRKNLVPTMRERVGYAMEQSKHYDPQPHLYRPEAHYPSAPESNQSLIDRQTQAEERFHSYQVNCGRKLLAQNKPVETAADVQNLNALKKGY